MKNTRITLILNIFLLPLAVMLTPGESQAFCSKPNPPYKPYSFTSNQQIESYNQQVDRFNQELAMYKECATRQINSYSQQYNDYLQCEAKSYGNAYSGCAKPTPPRF